MSEVHKVCTYCGYVGKPSFVLSKLKSIGCPKCTHATMVSLRSTEGQLVITQTIGQPRTWADYNEIVGSK